MSLGYMTKTLNQIIIFIKQLNPQFSGNSRSELTDIDGKTVNKLALSARLDHSCETG
jgi:hypothetical protein